MANGVTPRPNYQGGDISIFPYLQGIGNVLIANQQRAQAQQQAERERADKLYDEVQKLSTKVNPAGILAADYDDFMNIYQQDIKQNMIDAMMARQAGDTREYTKKIAAANEGIANANYLIGRSKARSEEYLTFQQSFNPEDYSDETGPLLSKLIETPTSRLGVNDTLVGNPAFMRKIDTSKVQGDIDGILKQLYDTSAKLSGTNATRSQGGNVLEFEESVDKDAFAQSLEYRFASDPAFKAFARENNLGATPEEAAINITALYEQQGRFTRTEGRQFVRDRAPSSSSGGNSRSTQVERNGIQYDYEIPFVNSSIKGRKHSGVSIPNLTVTKNTELVDLYTGQPRPNTSDYSLNGTVRGFISVPYADAFRDGRQIPLNAGSEQRFLREGGTVNYKDQAILETDEGTFLVDLDAVERANNTKAVKEEIEAFKGVSIPTANPNQEVTTQSAADRAAELIRKYSTQR